MSILSDKEIIYLSKNNQMIFPFEEKLISLNTKNEKVLSYGTSSYGYDARVSDNFKVFTNINSGFIDPKNFDPDHCIEKTGDFCIIPPNSFCLSHTIETFKIPRDVLVVCVGKSTYARCGIIVNVTPLEPEWEGQVTLEFSNTTQSPVKIYANEGCCQFLFFKANESCEQSYKDRNGKYSGQKGITFPKV